MKRNVVRLLATLGLGAAVFVSGTSSAEAATITFDQIVDGGTLSYGGNLGDPLVGSGIRFDTITDGTLDLECRGCTLAFTTGGSTVEAGAFNTYAGGGSFVITGSAYSGADLNPATADGALVASGTLLTGSFTGTQFLIYSSATNQVTFNGFGIDTKNEALLRYFNALGLNFVFANTSISASGGSIAGAFSYSVTEADVVNTGTAPEPASVGLFGLALFGLGGAIRRRFSN